MPVCVTSEIGSLKRVLLQRPGRELEHLSPNTMEQLLFDDIPYLYGAQQEHDCFAEILRGCGAEVVYLEDLTADVLRQRPELREPFIHDVIEGVTYQEIFPGRSGRLSSMVGTKARFLMPPIPNLYFTRDPFACIGRGVSLNHMYSATRSRETLYGKYVLTYHPDFAGQVPLYYTPEEHFSIEGGDILNLSPTVLAVGISQRTQPEAVERLAERIFADEAATIDTVLAFEIPRTRAFMHLDTVFTQVDRDKFSVHPGILEMLSIYELTGRGTGRITTRALRMPLEDVLKEYLHLDHVQLIRCGGGCEIAAEREQWNDGSNTLCVSPGVAVVYERNYVTNQILEDCGVKILKMPSSELSRGRGGPRCMSMPLLRESVSF